MRQLSLRFISLSTQYYSVLNNNDIWSITFYEQFNVVSIILKNPMTTVRWPNFIVAGEKQIVLKRISRHSDCLHDTV
jgi:hypothetical protein